MVEIRCLNDAHGERFAAYNGDCVDVVAQLPENSVGFSVYSPPFSNLFVYSDSLADMGNSASDGEFMKQYGYLLREMTRVTKPGRLSAVHCSDLPLTKWKDGMIGIKDLSGEIIRAHQDAGWDLHSRVTIWKCPVVEMTRCHLNNSLRVGQDSARFPVDQWQKWASPVWMDIRQTNTLNVAVAREDKDEKHLCPLQLDLIERCLIMWSNPDDIVLSPFMGIGSEGVMSLRNKRRFVGVELKDAYFRQAVKHMEAEERNAPTLFDLLAAD